MASDPEEGIPRPRFDHDEFHDRGYYVVTEFQDEKRRRDRVEAVKTARVHPNYVCLMNPDHRLLHRNRYTTDEVPLFRELHALIATWATPRYYVMGYPITPADLLRGVECFEKMGQTCNPLMSLGEDAFPSYFGCPRASVSLKYMHPKAWYAVFYAVSEDNPKRYDKREWSEAFDAPTTEDELEAMDVRGTVDAVREVSRKYCGCPLVHLRRTQAIHARLPESIEIGDGTWRMAPDMMGENSVQPVSKERYFALLADLGLETMACSDRPHPDLVEEEEEEPQELTQEERMKRFTWLLED